MLNIDPKTNKITIINGDTGNIHVEIDNYKLVEGDVLYFTAKKNIDDTDYDYCIVKKCTEFSEEGTCTIRLEPEDTKELSPGTYYYDIQVNLIDDRIDTIIGPCKLVINRGITGEKLEEFLEKEDGGE